ncbi:MAG: DUF1553 domain-containing protein, partial [Planctomycetaceae bacterium]|nr:DUF1553 domain-containing protein [Planctomycetaceae bacterium]
KFDALSSRDYYALSGYLQSSDYREVRFESMEHNGRIADALQQLDQQFRQQLKATLESTAAASSAKTMPALSMPALTMPALTVPSERILVDYTQPMGSEFRQEGFIWGQNSLPAGSLLPPGADSPGALLAAPVGCATSDHFWDGMKSHHGPSFNLRSRLMSIPRSGRTLWSPTVLLHDGIVDCRVRGGGFIVACVDSHRLIAGPLHGETVREFGAAEGWQWVRLNLGRYVGHHLHLEFTPADGQVLEVQTVLQGATEEDRQHVEHRERNTAEQVTAQLANVNAAIAAETDLQQQVIELQQQWQQQREDLRKRVQLESHLAMAMMDGTGENDHVLIRGSSANPGDVVPRRFLEALDGPAPMEIPSGSGRLQLAARMTDAANPLTARVIVNRIWH